MTGRQVIGSVVESIGDGASGLVVASVLLASWLGPVKTQLERRRARLLVNQRALEAQAAGIEASLEDAWFEPAEVSRTVDELIAVAECGRPVELLVFNLCVSQRRSWGTDANGGEQ